MGKIVILTKKLYFLSNEEFFKYDLFKMESIDFLSTLFLNTHSNLRITNILVIKTMITCFNVLRMFSFFYKHKPANLFLKRLF